MAPTAPTGLRVPDSRASERPTLKTLPPADEPSSGHGNTGVIELSASALDSDVSMVDLDLDRDRARGGELSPLGHLTAVHPGKRPRVALVVAVLALAVGVSPSLASTLGERATGVSAELRPPTRAAHQPASEHTPLAARVAVHAVNAPPGGCAALGAPRVLSTRAHLPPGLDVSVLDGGFGVGFASSSDEALGLRLRLQLDGLPLRVEDRVRVRGRAGTRMQHVAVEAPRPRHGDEHGEERGDDDELDVRVDADESRSVVPEGDAPSFRMAVRGGWIQLSARGKGGARTLWPVPGAAAKVKANASASASAKANASAKAPPALSGELRVAARDEGGAIVVLRRPSALWLGLVDAELAAEGPLLALTRPGAVLGTPSVAPAPSGGAVAWAERPAGEREWMVMVATFSGRAEGPGGGAAAPGGAGAGRRDPVLRPIAAGMSPSIAALPGGDLLLAYAVGAPGAHQVRVRRLGRDLELLGDAVVVSPDAVNAGQPATAVAVDGRALVAFFGAERGRPSSVIATPLSCSLGL